MLQLYDFGRSNQPFAILIEIKIEAILIEIKISSIVITLNIFYRVLKLDRSDYFSPKV